MLDVMEAAFKDFAAALPSPEPVDLHDAWGYRYTRKDAYQAVVLKLALIQSALRGALLLHQHGHLLEQGMLQRIIEEANEDVLFLVLGVANELTPLHQRYLNGFWREEAFIHDQKPENNQNADLVPRQKIRAYVTRFQESGSNPSRSVELSKFIHRMYSGFVHGAAAQIIEMYVGSPPYFHTRGLLGTPRMKEYGDDLWNYFYRGLLSHVFAAQMFGSGPHVERLLQFKKAFEVAAGKDY